LVAASSLTHPKQTVLLVNDCLREGLAALAAHEDRAFALVLQYRRDLAHTGPVRAVVVTLVGVPLHNYAQWSGLLLDIGDLLAATFATPDDLCIPDLVRVDDVEDIVLHASGFEFGRDLSLQFLTRLGCEG
jgi:hypothetical protein